MNQRKKTGIQKSYYLERIQVETISKVALLEDRSENQVLRRIVAAGMKALGILDLSTKVPE